MPGAGQQPVGEFCDLCMQGNFILPVLRYSVDTIVCAGQLTTDRGGGIGIIAQVGGGKNRVGVIIVLVKAPHGSFQTFNHIAAATQFLALLIQV